MLRDKTTGNGVLNREISPDVDGQLESVRITMSFSRRGHTTFSKAIRSA
jgi:hypothetical protein